MYFDNATQIQIHPLMLPKKPMCHMAKTVSYYRGVRYAREYDA